MLRWFVLGVVGLFTLACIAVDRLGAATVYFAVVKPVLDIPPAELLGWSLLGNLIDATILAAAIAGYRRWRTTRRTRRALTDTAS